MSVTYILNQYVLKGKKISVRGWMLFAFFLLITASVLVALGLSLSVSTKIQAPVSADRMQNPELMVVHRYRTGAEEKAAPSNEATNPELMLHRQYVESAPWNSEPLFLVSNPELMLHRQYVESAPWSSEPLYLASNPEITPHRRFVELQAVP